MTPHPRPPPRTGLLTSSPLRRYAALPPRRTGKLPDKPITFVVPFAAGSATDQLARAIGQSVTPTAKQAVVVDNKPGASGIIAAQPVAKAAPDGYTVLITTNTTHAANEHLYKKLPYDPVKDFAPVTRLGKGGQIMVVNADSPVQERRRFRGAAKKKPGKLTFGSGSSSSRIAGELFKQMAGTYILHVPYKSNPLGDHRPARRPDRHDDHRHGHRPAAGQGRQAARARRVDAPSASPLVPDVPTIDEAGVKGYDMGYWFAAYVPANTPAPRGRRA